MHSENIEEAVTTIRYEEKGLPPEGEPTVPWILKELDPSAIASRTLVKSFNLANEDLIHNVQRHEAERGRLFSDIYEQMLTKHGLSLKDSKVLEVGAGPGAVCLGFQEIGAKVVSLDIWDGRVFYDNEVPFVIGDGTALPFADNSFNYLSLTSVLHHLPIEYRKTMLEEGLRVADTVLIQEDCLTSPITNIAMKLVDDGVSGEVGTHQAESHMTKGGWLNYFEEANLNVLESVDYHPKWLGVGIEKAFFVVSRS